MKKLIFMRHGYLEGKYRDYSKLHFKDFENLLLKKVAPPVDKNITKKELLSKGFLPDVSFVICSSENRSIETAQIVKDITRVDFEVSSLLDEINFTNGIIKKEDVSDFNKLRKTILTKFFHSDCSENFETVKKRFLDFLNYVRNLDHNLILCVTHGWFMRLIYIYSVKGSLEGVLLEELLEARVPSFLETAEVSL